MHKNAASAIKVLCNPAIGRLKKQPPHEGARGQFGLACRWQLYQLEVSPVLASSLRGGIRSLTRSRPLASSKDRIPVIGSIPVMAGGKYGLKMHKPRYKLGAVAE